jgi:hypothetical protein
MNDLNENQEAVMEHRMSVWWGVLVIILILGIGLPIIGFVFKGNFFNAGFEAVFADIFEAIRRTIGF